MEQTRAPLGPLQLALLIAIPVLLLVTFRDGLSAMVRWWQEPEYTHGYLIPFLAAYLFLIRADTLAEARPAPSWVGVGVVVLGVLGLVVGELSALYVIVQYAFLLTLWGLAITLLGLRGSRAVWASLVFLVFLVPLPYFVQFNLSAELQLISTDLGAGVLRLLGVPVYVEGNVIDMGVSKLQVVDACSGLRYLFPLMSLSFICGYLFKGPLWQRWFIFLSAIPITVVMNSVRIAITGILYDNYGIGAGDDFLHYFEGWVIFVACMALLFGEMALLARLNRRKLDDALDVEIPKLAAVRRLGASLRVGPPTMAVAGILVAGLAGTLALAGRTEIIPEHQSLAGFPLSLGEWRGREGDLTPEELGKLKLTDYTLIDYARHRESPVQLYVAYYESQRKGASVHSPKACIPGGGWRINEFTRTSVPGARADGGPVPVNRAVISMGNNRVLVYYWFMQRGRYLTNEYLVKWYIFWDSLTRQRTDGSLVRLVTPVPDGMDIAEADARLAEFVRTVEPRLYYHLPQDVIVQRADSPVPPG